MLHKRFDQPEAARAFANRPLNRRRRARAMRLAASLLLLTSAGSLLYAAATDDATTAAARISSDPGLAEQYHVLLTRSIFSKDGRAAPDPRSFPRQGSWGQHNTPATTQSAPSYYSAPNPEANYVLRGVGMQDGVYTAFFEQTTENKGYTYHVGDKIARGNILAMSLDGVEYANSTGRPTRILIGQTLDGRTIEAPAAASSSESNGDWRSRWHHSETPAATTGTTPNPAPAAGPSPFQPPGGDQSRGETRRWGERNRDDRNRDERSRDERQGPQQPGAPEQGARPGENGPPGAPSAPQLPGGSRTEPPEPTSQPTQGPPPPPSEDEPVDFIIPE